jgi:hypothetical protein
MHELVNKEVQALNVGRIRAAINDNYRICMHKHKTNICHDLKQRRTLKTKSQSHSAFTSRRQFDEEINYGL